jgi:hypothetical protein
MTSYDVINVSAVARKCTTTFSWTFSSRACVLMKERGWNRPGH